MVGPAPEAVGFAVHLPVVDESLQAETLRAVALVTM